MEIEWKVDGKSMERSSSTSRSGSRSVLLRPFWSRFEPLFAVGAECAAEREGALFLKIKES